MRSTHTIEGIRRKRAVDLLQACWSVAGKSERDVRSAKHLKRSTPAGRLSLLLLEPYAALCGLYKTAYAVLLLTQHLRKLH